jgi:hypothetical protein
MSADVLSVHALNRALLDRQMLLRRRTLPPDELGRSERAERVIETVEHLAGLQAPFPPYYGLWSRLADFRPEDLAELILSRQVVRIAPPDRGAITAEGEHLLAFAAPKADARDIRFAPIT